MPRMNWTSHVAVHESAQPPAVRPRILDGLKRRELDPSLLYGGLRQTLRWVHLHHAVSPARKDPNVVTVYEAGFRRAAELCQGNVVHVVSLACGDGTKDTRCLQILRETGRTVIYTPADVSLEMALTAENTATSALRGLQTTPLLCELTHCSVLPALLKNFDPSGAERVVLFLGTIHNFWPPEVLKSALYPVRSQDYLLIGANLAPEEKYEEVLRTILRQYDNAPTHHWLMGALSELSIGQEDGAIEWSLVDAELDPSLKRIQADFIFGRTTRVHYFGEQIEFVAGEKLRLFYSYRFTPRHLRRFLVNARLRVLEEWMASSGEEGLFLCRRASEK